MRHRLKPAIALVPFALLVACSQEKPAEDAANQDAAAANTELTLPNVSAAAPGVAFTFAYAFTLPANKISDVQQQHAAACGRLGLDRCRVTGMDYRLPDEGEAEGRLALLLSPEAAPAFGREAVELVRAADGKVADATLTGEDAGAQIDTSHQTSRTLKAEQARIEARLATRSLTRESRTELESRLTELRRELASQGESRTRAERSLATTPVTLTYASEGLLGAGNAFSSAAKASWSSLTTLLSFLLIAGGTILPWAALSLLVWFAWRRLRQAPKTPEAAG